LILGGGDDDAVPGIFRGACSIRPRASGSGGTAEAVEEKHYYRAMPENQIFL